MNSDPNSDLKQCPKSKLSRVHSAPTHGPGCAHTAPRPCAQLHVVAPARPYRGLIPGHIVVVSQEVHRPCSGRVVAHGSRVTRHLLRVVSRAGPHRVAAPPVISQAPPCCVVACYVATSGPAVSQPSRRDTKNRVAI